MMASDISDDNARLIANRKNPPKMRSMVFASVICFATLLPAASQDRSGKFDGPAELPRVEVSSSLVDTPAPGKVRVLKPSENLQEALDAARCGYTITLDATH